MEILERVISFFLSFELIHIAAGSLVGFVIGLTGVGGGSLMTPILVLGFGIAPAIAVGTDLLYAALTKCSGVFFHHRNKTVDWHVVGLLAMGSVPSSLITVALLEQVKTAGFNSDRLMMLTLSIMLVLTSIIILIKGRLLTYVSHRHGNSTLVNLLKTYRPHITVFSGVALGILVTISSVGAGAIGSAILFLLYPRKKPVAIVGTDIAHAVPLTAIAGMGHLHFGSVDYDLLFGLLAGGIPAIYLGSLVGRYIPDNWLRISIAILLFAMGVKLAL
ncbi:MAG TPA: sulfite exporter TauE/SafE family protein [Methyloprofundus sp.]|uniref:sulfite exporter TauE/SafE family protein n=1 Tax=Methyloprofundus sp. TaxID=2020875 RepID=UPI0017F42273|nr:sulfite exporter TauE/SafE family protein [Methyloprofundus sp.]HIG65098.1 sulfite exporter TauE/SafE family protein [Methyloprofundus sp.]HIL78432.1 sulfite exporter TauE/SafE family protein [Methylococcales bacterium]